MVHARLRGNREGRKILGGACTPLLITGPALRVCAVHSTASVAGCPMLGPAVSTRVRALRVYGAGGSDKNPSPLRVRSQVGWAPVAAM